MAFEDQLVAEWNATPPRDRLPFLLCLYTGDVPPYCTPMLRDPAPPIGMSLESGLIATYRAALAQNPAVHDGAIMLGRRSKDVSYRVTAWSMRLYPPPVAHTNPPNRGSAFNSCLEMSCVERVDCMYLVSEGRLIRLSGGLWSKRA